MVEKQGEANCTDDTIDERTLEPIQIALYSNLAACYLQQNKIDESDFYNSACLEKDPTHVKSLYRSVQLLLKDDKFDEALAEADRIISADTTKEDDLKLFHDLKASVIAA